jgi:hypothetical protein
MVTREHAAECAHHGARGCDFCVIFGRPHIAPITNFVITLRQVLGCKNRESHRVARRVLHPVGIFSRFLKHLFCFGMMIPHVWLGKSTPSWWWNPGFPSFPTFLLVSAVFTTF